jgi:hypothetical protein
VKRTKWDRFLLPSSGDSPAAPRTPSSSGTVLHLTKIGGLAWREGPYGSKSDFFRGHFVSTSSLVSQGRATRAKTSVASFSITFCLHFLAGLECVFRLIPEQNSPVNVHGTFDDGLERYKGTTISRKLEPCSSKSLSHSFLGKRPLGKSDLRRTYWGRPPYSGQFIPQPLAIQGPGMIASVWPDWVILLYIIGVELTVE